jgi:hypothetical protein
VRAVPAPPAPTDPDAPSEPSAPPPHRGRQVAIALVAVVLAPVLLGCAFLIPGHAPKPNGLPVAVVGAAAPAARQATTLRRSGFAVRRLSSPQAARRQILDRRVYGAIVLRGSKPAQVLVASAASYAAAQAIEQAAAGAKPTDVRPLDPDDPNGTSLNLLVLPIVFTATFLALAGVALLPAAGAPRRAALALAGALAGGFALMVVGRFIVGVVPGPWLGEGAVLSLGVLAMALPIGGLVRLLGFRAMMLGFLFFTVLGNPGSGLASAPEMLPSPWHPLGAWLPVGAAGTALRDVAYFDGAALLQPLLVLAGWAVVGLVLLVLGEQRHPQGRPTPLSVHETPAAETAASGA